MTITTRPGPAAPARPVAPDALRLPGAGELGLGRATGAPLRREGPEKLTGLASYADDLVFPGAWYGATIRSTDPHARLLGFDFDADFDWSRVIVVTAEDIPGDNVVSLISDDQPILIPVGGTIRHQAEPLALLAAADRETLREARRRIHPRTERLEPIFDPLASTQVFAQYAMAKGDVEAGFAEADVVVEGTYRVGHQEQLYIENQAMIAVPREDGGMTVTGSLQCPYYVHKALKRALALDSGRAVVIQAETGGGFGGKEEYPSLIAIHAALLARRVSRPVRMIYDRHEDLAATTKRHPAIVRHRTGVMRDGALVAQDIDLVLDGGAYCTLTPVVLSRAAIHAGGPYDVPERAHHGACGGHQHARPTAPSAASARRSRSSPPRSRSAGWRRRIGISPLEIRRRNCYRAGGVTPTGQVLRDERGGRGGPRARRRGRRVRARARADGARARRPRRDGERIGARASGWRWPGMAPASPARARRRWARWPASS